MQKNEPYLAHKEKEREQTILEHINGTANLAGQYASAFGKEAQGKMAGYFHDIGKFSAAFQKRIRNPESTEKCDHSTAGAVEAWKMKQLAVAICIMGHHGGLLNLGKSNDTSRSFKERLIKGIDGEIPDYHIWKEQCGDFDFSGLNAEDPSQTAFGRYVETKLLYSSLVDADYLDTEAFVNGGEIPRGGYDSMEQLRERLEQYLEKQGWLEAQTGINGMRTEILETAARKGKNMGRGIYTLTVPTGGGKTVSSLRFGIHHAVEHGLERVIYVVPYTNIIEQTAETFRNILGSQNVLEHHSNVLFEEKEDEWKRFQLACENWDMPIIITTAVQFFESFFHNKPSRCRKLHNIANSVIIYDEAQMIPVNYWIPCIRAVEELSASCRATQVLCTATQPAVVFSEQTKVLEITENTKAYFKSFKRVTFRDAGKMDLEEAADRVKASEQILCIVNTKKTAKQLFDMIESKGGVYHLTTMMVPVHREEVLGKIKERLREGLPCKVIATSLVEAGVDLDFRKVMREQAGLDSILQAAGRCNRNGRYLPDESVVEVFSLGGKGHPGIRQQVDAARCVMREYEQWDSLEAVEAYFKFWRQLRGEENLDKKQIMEKVERYAFREIAENFHLIENDTYTVYVPWKEEGERLVGMLKEGQCHRALYRALGRYSVSVFEPHFKELLRMGDVEFVNGTAVLTNEKLYRQDTGLEFQAEEGIAIFF